MKKIIPIFLLPLLLSLLLQVTASAQTFPNKPIKIVVGYAAGGAVDVVARSVGQSLSASTGQPVLVDNKPGAGTNIAVKSVIAAEPDGYTLLMAANALAANMALYQPNFRLLFQETEELVFDRIVFDDHTEKQVKFLQGLDTDRCIFIRCDDDYRKNFSDFISEHYGANKYARYEYQNVSVNNDERRRFKTLFQRVLEREPKYLKRLLDYYEEDYQLIQQVQFYGTR